MMCACVFFIFFLFDAEYFGQKYLQFIADARAGALAVLLMLGQEHSQCDWCEVINGRAEADFKTKAMGVEVASGSLCPC